MDMKIAITGASGYIGFKLLSRFLEDGNKLLAITRSSNKKILSLAKKYSGSLEICELDVDDLFFCIHKFAPDTILSTSCCYESDPKFLNKTVTSNYIFPSQVLKSALQLEKKVRFISIGTSLPESLNLYSLTKKQFAELGAFFSRTGKIQFINVLSESFYSADEPANRFIKASILSLLANKDLDVTEGTQHRDYVSTEDVINILGFLTTADSLTDSYYDIPLGSGTAPSIREILEFLKQECHSDASLRFGAVAARPHEPSTRADLTMLRKLGYNKNTVFWKDGMIAMIKELNK